MNRHQRRRQAALERGRIREIDRDTAAPRGTLVAGRSYFPLTLDNACTRTRPSWEQHPGAELRK